MAITRVKGATGELSAGHGSSTQVVYRYGVNYESSGTTSSIENRPFYHDYRPLVTDGSAYDTDGVNMFFGFGSGNFTMAPDAGAIGTYNLHTSHNIGFGIQALGNLTTGYKNTGLGTNTLRYATQGYGNTAVGRDASHNLTTAFENTSIGFTALFGVTTGNYNVGVGSGCGYNNTAGHGNVSVGRRAAYDRTTGNYNTTMGHLAGNGQTAGAYNTQIGHQASNSGITTADNTTIIGARFSGLPDADELVVLGDGAGNEVLKVDLGGTGNSKLDIVANDATAYDLTEATAQIDSGSTMLLRSITNVGNALVQIVAQSRVNQMFSRIMFWGGTTQNVSIIQDEIEAVRWNSLGDVHQRVNTSAAALGINNTMTFELASNTSLTIKVRGTDGTTRSVALTLA